MVVMLFPITYISDSTPCNAYAAPFESLPATVDISKLLLDTVTFLSYPNSITYKYATTPAGVNSSLK